MERLVVISKIDEPTEWCSPMIIVLKANRKVRIYVDHTKLNKHVKQDLHVLTTVDHLLAQLGEAEVMNKLDVNSGYWQIPLSS